MQLVGKKGTGTRNYITGTRNNALNDLGSKNFRHYANRRRLVHRVHGG
jgi:hypothetical protein